MTDTRQYRITPAKKFPILFATTPPKISGVPKSPSIFIQKSKIKFLRNGQKDLPIALIDF
jgi:hypothetical protein